MFSDRPAHAIVRQQQKRWRHMKIMRLSEVEKATGLSSPTIKKLESQGDFPKRFKLTPTTNRWSWVEDEIKSWVASRAASSRQQHEVPLTKAMLCYNIHPKPGRRRVAVIAHPARQNGHSFRHEPFDLAYGANQIRWGELSDRSKMLALFRAAWIGATLHNIPLEQLNGELRRIPELRNLLMDGVWPVHGGFFGSIVVSGE
jgi:predicted DNA-binding transcriptional regulator AlpA